MFTLSLGYASRRCISGFNIELVVNFKFSRSPAMLALALLLSSFFHIAGVPRRWPSPSSHPVHDWGVFFKDRSENCVIIINYLLSVFRMPLQQLCSSSCHTCMAKCFAIQCSRNNYVCPIQTLSSCVQL